MAERSKPKRSFHAITLLIAGMGILLCGISFVLAEFEFQRDMESRTHEVNSQNATLTLAMEQNLNRSIAQADAILQFMKAEIESDGTLDLSQVRLLRDFLNPGIFNQIAVADSRGNIVYSALPLKAAVNIADMENFKAQEKANSEALYIAAPLANRATGATSIFLSHRLNDAGGNFAGIVLIGLAPDYFSNVFGPLRMEADNSFVLLKIDGTFLTRIPGVESAEIVAAYKSHPVIARLNQGVSSGILEWWGVADGVARVGAFRSLSNYPAVVLVGISKNAVFQKVTERRQDYRNWAGMFSTVLTVTLLLLWRRLRKQYQAEEALRDANENLEYKVEERTQELQGANEELIAQKEEMISINETITTLNQDLEGMNKELEQRVAERTVELTTAQQDLIMQIEALEKAQDMLHCNVEIQAVLHEIAEATVQEPSLGELYKTVHQQVERVLPAKNFYITLLNEQDNQLEIVYCVDETHTVPTRRPVGKGLADYVMSRRKAVCVTAPELARLRESGEVLVRLVNYSIWAGAPLIDSTGKAFGTIALFMVAEEELPLTPEGMEVLSIVAAQISMTIERKQAQEALRDSEEKYRLIFKHSPMGLTFFDSQGVIVACNDYFVQIIGSSQNNLVGLNMLNLPDKHLSAAVQTALEGHPGSYEGLYRSRTPKKVTPVRCLFAPVVTAGHLQGGVGIVEDVTEQRRSRKELQAANESLERKVAERTQELQGANEELLSQNDELLSLHQILKDMNETLELRVEKRTLELTTAHRDLTEQYGKLAQAEEEVRNNGEHLRKLIQYANAPIVVWDPDFIVTRFNKVFERLSGYAWNEIVGKPVFLLFPADRMQETEALIEQSRGGRQWEAVEIPIRCKNGEVRMVLWNSANIYDTDAVTLKAVIAQGQDITERVRRENELRRDAQLATRMQAALLSEPKSSDHLTIATIYQPFGYVSGDLYFLDWRYNNQLLRGFLVDAVGHGLGTALHTASLHVLLREVNECDLPLSEAMRSLNQRAGEYFDKGTFAGALGFELDLETREIRWVCAGIPRLWMSTQTAHGMLECVGMSLGINAEELFEQHTLPIEVGDSCYFMTDGLSDHLGRCVAQPVDCFPEMVDMLRTLTESPERRDDATAVCIHIRSLPEATVRKDGWPRSLRFNGYGDYLRLKVEVAKILMEVTGLPHSRQEVAVTEALCNALECRDGVSRQQQARLRINKVGNRLVVRVKTSRIGFAGNAILRRLRSHPEDMFSFGEDAAMGRGIPIMLTMAHKMTYNNDGTEVLLAWKLS